MMAESGMHDGKQETDMHDVNRDEEFQNQGDTNLHNSLASPDRGKREKAMSLLCLWLMSQEEIKEEELAKIWKGLFYCLWHAEEEVTQVDLADRMASLLGKLNIVVSQIFFSVFLKTLRNEWGDTDNYTEGRFQLVLKKFIFHMFGALKKSEWDIEIVREFMNALTERALLLQDGIHGDNINVYVVTVFLHELRQYLPVPSDAFEVLLEPFWRVFAKGCNERIAEAIGKSIFLVLFEHANRLLNSDHGVQDGNEDWACFGSSALNLSFLIWTKSSALLASMPESRSSQLKMIEEKFARLEKVLAQSRISCSSTDEKSLDIAKSGIEGANDNAISAVDMKEVTVSPGQHPVTQTFGRRGKRNQKLAFNSQSVDNVCMQDGIASSGTSGEDIPMQLQIKQQFEVDGDASLDPRQHKLMSSNSEHDHDSGDVINDCDSSLKEDIDKDGSTMLIGNGDGITMEDPVISNLAKRFESIADQSPSCAVDISTDPLIPFAPSPVNTGMRKRKSLMSSPLNTCNSESPSSAKENSVVSEDAFQGVDIGSVDDVSAKKAKKVHFSLQHNIVWQPSTPLPPHDVRVPPAATPRGSALKKGVLPGPIIELGDVESVSPRRKRKKKASSKRSPAAQSKSPKGAKQSGKENKAAKEGRLSPR
ncbi:hypothetical protein KP509_27G057800 [Ceratopteris richardii]|uniref:Uncharacterized protein n=1 Tax=Ceratopteris richardii TaxID=49495 RepID=A0A8T2RGK7_CERRI|nr:hypothetical protein KP509_27G057800 [Ceratopteris richardii]KAH7295620.1 hypothetical protein KP509_27G057800 [Ceratopteris richardii]KAH7295621.1 hypothetical protein KP509_27G057800 [Ceratopteris richardii]KAH7295622.1 hypothetical protein KP509_27G057800 [Ceratopteris richardii]